jgi:hypothetical protein
MRQLWDVKSRIVKSLTPRPELWLAAVLVSGFIAYYLDSRPVERENPRQAEDVETAATFIPEGFVLVPIEVSNFESLDSILGKYGVVDLYAPADDPKRQAVKIAERVRILRAPLNPSHFAVLIPESDSQRIVMHPGPLLVVVQPQTVSGTKIVYPEKEKRAKRSPRSRIDVEPGPEEKGAVDES